MNNKKPTYLIAFDVLIETLVNHQKADDNLLQLNEIAKKYNVFYETEEFSQVLKERVSFYINHLINEDDSLFIQDAHIPFVVKNNILFSQIEKLEIYIIILFWVRDFKLTEPTIFYKLASHLRIDYAESENINQLINNVPGLETQNIFFRLFSATNSEIDLLEGEWVKSNMPENTEGYIINPSERPGYLEIIYLEKNKLFLVSLNTADFQISMTDQILPETYYLVKPGETIRIGKEFSISFVGLKKKLIEKKYGKKYYLSALNAANGSVKTFSFIGEPGELIGIIGKEGSGKSAILKLLSGYEKPQTGNVCINGYDLTGFYYQLSGLIGYVSEDDILIPELSVYDNLAMAVRLFLRNSSDYDINVIVNNVLNETGLFHCRNIIVGTTNEKNLQPGQRWLLNIAFELIRDPLILIVDNSKHPLSMNDSSTVLEVLTKYTFKGKLVITSITQTRSNVFENIDKIMIVDNEGTVIYFGDRTSAVETILSQLPKGYALSFELHGKTGADALFDVLEFRKSTENLVEITQLPLQSGKIHQDIFSMSLPKIEEVRAQKKIPSKQFHSPRLEKQFLNYSFRNFKTKIAKRKELAFTLFAAPVFALLLALIFRKSDSTPYQFSTNPNIPAFFFISILANTFIALIVSVKEIIKEKNILKKELFLNLSLFSYINSKVFYLFILLSIQTLLYTITANFVLSIYQMTFYHWLIYFSLGAFGIMLGLIISSICSNLETATLKIIPLFIIILLIFGCGWIPPSHIKNSHNKYTPVVSDFMVSRWAYEAMVVKQFTDNPYQRNFNTADEKISMGAFNSFHVLPLLREYIEQNASDNKNRNDSIKQLVRTVGNRFRYFLSTEKIYPFEYTDSLIKGIMDEKIKNEAIEYITYLDYYFYDLYSSGLKQKQIIIDSINSVDGVNASENLKNSHQNATITQLIRNSSQRQNYKVQGDEIIQLTDPIYNKPLHNFGRSQLFQSMKKFNNQIIDTYEFNLSIIWLFTLLGYVLLISNIINILFRLDI